MKVKNDFDALLEEKILPYVQKPSRYLGNEHGTTVKDPGSVSVKFALAFPDFYELGMSHIGMGIIYDVLNRKDYIACERVYLPYPDMKKKMEENNIRLFSLESREKIKNFDIVGFSLQYELSYVNVLLMLELSGIPLFSEERDVFHPFVGAGGPCAFNPLPLNAFMDFFIIGDGEEAVVQVSDAISACKERLKTGMLKKTGFREHVKRELSEIPGVYVPGVSKTVKKALFADLNSSLYIQNNIVPFVETVHNRLSVEIARGCSSGCRFCQAGYIYRPVRERKAETVLDIIKNGFNNTGINELSLSSLSTGDYSEINGLMGKLMDFTVSRNISMSFPSMRVGSLSGDIIRKTGTVKKTNFTLAPEAGTQRLRNIINKNISENDLLDEVGNLSGRGFKTIKLYFMIGLPFERLSDIEGIRDLVLKVKRVSGNLNITVNVNNFIPKPHTPFQWFPLDSTGELVFKINYLKKLLKPLKVNIRYQDPEVSIVEALISRGDENASKIIYHAYKLGGAYSSEIKQFDFSIWEKAVLAACREVRPELRGSANHERNGLAYEYLYREKNISDVLPWDFIDTMVEKNYLKKEYEKSFEINGIYNGKSAFSSLSSSTGDAVPGTGTLKDLSTENCRSVCHLCGVCDFKEISPVYSFAKNKRIYPGKPDEKEKDAASEDALPAAGYSSPGTAGPKTGGNNFPVKKLTLIYSKKGDMKYLGHIETVKVFLRAFNIAGLSVVYSNSRFSPKPKISCSNPLPFMSESEESHISVLLKNDIPGRSTGFEDIFNGILPAGLKVLRAELI